MICRRYLFCLRHTFARQCSSINELALLSEALPLSTLFMRSGQLSGISSILRREQFNVTLLTSCIEISHGALSTLLSWARFHETRTHNNINTYNKETPLFISQYTSNRPNNWVITLTHVIFRLEVHFYQSLLRILTTSDQKYNLSYQLRALLSLVSRSK